MYKRQQKSFIKGGEKSKVISSSIMAFHASQWLGDAELPTSIEQDPFMTPLAPLPNCERDQMLHPGTMISEPSIPSNLTSTTSRSRNRLLPEDWHPNIDQTIIGLGIQPNNHLELAQYIVKEIYRILDNSDVHPPSDIATMLNILAEDVYKATLSKNATCQQIAQVISLLDSKISRALQTLPTTDTKVTL
jgi:hypothetical protein